MAEYKVLENLYLVKEDQSLLVGDVIELDAKRAKAINSQLGREVFEKVETETKKTTKKAAKEEAE